MINKAIEQAQKVGIDRLGFQQRVVYEKAELDEKITKLAAFIETFSAPFSVFGALPEPERYRLYAQHRAMVAYSAILGERIAAFGGVR